MGDDILSEAEVLARLRARGLAMDEARAARLRTQAAGLLTRLARIGASLPRDAAPPPLGPLDRHPETARAERGT